MIKYTVRSYYQVPEVSVRPGDLYLLNYMSITSKERGNTRMYHPDVGNGRAIVLYEAT